MEYSISTVVIHATVNSKFSCSFFLTILLQKEFNALYENHLLLELQDAFNILLGLINKKYKYFIGTYVLKEVFN